MGSGEGDEIATDCVLHFQFATRLTILIWCIRHKSVADEVYHRRGLVQL